MKNPDPNVMRAVFNDPKALERLSDILAKRDTDPQKNRIIVNDKTYIVRTSSTINKLKDL